MADLECGIATSKTDDFILEPKVACEVINQATANVRVAMLEHAEALLRNQIKWAPQSDSLLVEAVDEAFCMERGGNSSRPEWQLIAAVCSFVEQQFLKINGNLVENTSDDELFKLRLAGSCNGFPVTISREHQLLREPELPYLIEGLSRGLECGFPSFRQVLEAEQEFRSFASRIQAHVASRMRQRQEMLILADEPTSKTLNHDLSQSEIFCEAVQSLQDLISRIAYNLQAVALAINRLKIPVGKVDEIRSELDQSVGFQSIGKRLLDLLFSRFRNGNFTITLMELANLKEISRNELGSAILAMKSQELIIQTGWGDGRLFWLMPMLCVIAAVDNDAAGNEADMQQAQALNDRPDFRNLLVFAEKQLTPQQQKGLKYIITNGAKVPLEDLALHMDWKDPIKNSWDGLMKRTNDAIRTHNSERPSNHKGVARIQLMLRRRKGCAELSSEKSTLPRKKQASRSHKTLPKKPKR